MLKNFNAVKEPWIPVMTSRGVTVASLFDAFDSSFGGIALSEGAWGGLPYLNLLIAIATDACRPQVVADIQSYLDDPVKFSMTVRRYLMKNKDRFDLFGKNPFLQIGCYDFKTLKIAEPKHIRDATDTFTTEGATTAQVRDNLLTEITSEARIVQMLLKSLVYGCNKKTLNSTKHGSAVPNFIDFLGNIVGSVQEVQPEVSPIRTTNSGSSGTMNIFVESNNLIHTVILNMISENEVKTIWPLGFGKPIYLQDTDDHNKMVAEHKNLDRSFLGHLVPLTKYIRILTDEEASNKKVASSRAWVVCSHAAAYSFQEALQELKTANRVDNNYYAEPSNPKAKYTRGIIRPNSSLWKEFAGFNLQVLPKVLSKFEQMEVHETVTVRSVGMEGSGSVGLVYNEKLYESSISLEGPSLKDYASGGRAHVSFKIAGDKASEVSSKLYYAVQAYAKDLYGDKCECGPYTEEASRFYWHNLDKVAQQFIRRVIAEDGAAEKDWENFCIETAKDIIRDIKDGSVRRNKAVAKALKKLV